jgi:hypothetical protein
MCEWITADVATALQALGSVASVAVAIAALGYAVHSEKRAAKQALELQERAEAHSRLLHAPALAMHTLIFGGKRGIVLDNNGIGPSKIKSALFERDGRRSAAKVTDVLDFPPAVQHVDNYRNFSGPNTIVPPGGQIVILMLTHKLLTEELGLSTDEAESVMNDLGRQIAETQITIQHEDLLGTPQTPVTLSA